MARTSVFLTSVVSLILGIAIGAVSVGVLASKLSPDAQTVATQLSDEGVGDVKPQVYGNR
jgi:hypothetical protein